VTDKLPPNLNLQTGELTDEVQIRPFAEMLTILDRGEAHAAASRGLHDLIGAVQALGRKGGLTISIEVAPLKGTQDQLILTAQVTTKMPKADPTSQMFFVDQSGNLSRNDPRQMEIDGLRVVEPAPARIVNLEN
jgi:hypothetical protein